MRRATTILARLPQHAQSHRFSHRFPSFSSVPTRSLSSEHDPASAAPSISATPVDSDVLATISSSAGAASGAIDAAADAVVSLHDTLPQLGVPGTLVLSAALVRLASSPLLYWHQLHNSRAASAGRELAAVQQWVRRTPGSLVQKYLSFRRLRRVALQSAGTSSLAQFPWFLTVHVPLVVTLSLGVRALAARRPAEWGEAGPSWAADLCVADPTAALPALTTALWLWNVSGRTVAKSNTNAKKPGEHDAKDAKTAERPSDAEHPRKKAAIERVLDARRGQWMTTALQGLAILSFPYILDVPAGVHILWIANGALTAAQRAGLRSSSFRRMIGLPTAAEIESMSGPPVLRATAEAMRSARKQLEYVQSKVLTQFPNRSVDERLRLDVNRALERELFARRISIQLEAVVRKDGDSGRPYLAVVKKGSAKQ